jgi:Mitochondrial K+-H+ exchange-related
MQVFLIPIGADQYEPYYEPVDGEEEAPAVEDGGFIARQRRRLAEMLREAEAERHRRHAPDGAVAAAGWGARIKRSVMRLIVERAAEQRLLWHLRTADAATLHAPDDMAAHEALSVLIGGLKRDADRHFRWFLVNLVLLIVSGIFFFIPGPNLIGYYFTFTTVGHLLAWRGASRGGARVAWQVAASEPLTGLRAALRLPAPGRETRLQELADRLGLQHLVTFVERLAIPSA